MGRISLRRVDLIAPGELLICNKCGEKKSTEEFGSRVQVKEPIPGKVLTYHYYNGACNPCRAAYQKEWEERVPGRRKGPRAKSNKAAISDQALSYAY